MGLPVRGSDSALVDQAVRAGNSDKITGLVIGGIIVIDISDAPTVYSSHSERSSWRLLGRIGIIDSESADLRGSRDANGSARPMWSSRVDIDRRQGWPCARSIFT